MKFILAVTVILTATACGSEPQQSYQECMLRLSELRLNEPYIARKLAGSEKQYHKVCGSQRGREKVLSRLVK